MATHAPITEKSARREPTMLRQIADRRALDLEGELGDRTLAELRRDAAAAPAPREVVGRLARPGLHLIAELKRSSPSAGTIVSNGMDVADRARAYQAGGASMVSVLVEPHWFGGSMDDLKVARSATSLPVLAKEFVVDPRQLPALRAAGADAVLLLAALHPPARLARLTQAAFDLGLEPLVEAHDARELEAAVATGARLIGINNRNLRSLEVDPTTAERLRAFVPRDRVVIAESGVRASATIRRWRALGFDAALVGEDLMRSGDDAVSVRARAATFVAAGAEPRPGEDAAVDGRRPFVKVCGLTERVGLAAAIAAGVHAIGLNFVRGTPRALEEEEAAELIAAARAMTAAGDGPSIVGVFADRPADEVAAISARLGLDMVQLHGHEGPGDLDRIPLPVLKVLHIAAADDEDEAQRDQTVATFEAEAAAFADKHNLHAILLDTSDPDALGGTGRRASVALARAAASRWPVVLAGGLDAANVAGALIDIPAIGVDVSSGVEPRPRPQGRPPKDPFRVALFVKRAAAARLDRPTVAFGPRPVDIGLLDPDVQGRWGTDRGFGGRYVPETLMAALLDLEAAYKALRDDPAFWAELRDLGHRYVGRPTPIYRADRLAAELERRAGREPGRLRLYLKREDLNHTGAHKINNALGQAFMTQRLGKQRVIAETGAGQHGVATATACALLDMECVVYMGAEDIRRQAPNVLRMRALGAEVREVTSGTATLKDAVNETMRDWVTNVETTHYVLGSAVGPHPFPAIVRDLQRVIGDEAAVQMREVEGRLPDIVMACVGGGSNAIGLMARFIGEPDSRLIGVEAAGEGLEGRHAAALGGGSPGVLHGSRSYLLQDDDGQVTEAHSISAGLDYPGVGPQLSALFEAGRLEVLSATDERALEGVRLMTLTEGILPALEVAHAVSALEDLLAGSTAIDAPDPDAVVLMGLSGRGDKDIAAVQDRLMTETTDAAESPASPKSRA
jgi:tryptophan synthase beta subunit